jgi:hypothetical protein
MVSEGRTVCLFSYGTLQRPEVQIAIFGRLLVGESDTLRGYVLRRLQITDERVVKLSGANVHSIASSTLKPADEVPGMAFEISEAELFAADEYEVDAYRRSEVLLASGRRAFVYVGAPIA